MKRTRRSSKSVVVFFSGSDAMRTCLEKVSEFPVEFARNRKNPENTIVAKNRGRLKIRSSCYKSALCLLMARLTHIDHLSPGVGQSYTIFEIDEHATNNIKSVPVLNCSMCLPQECIHPSNGP